MLEDNVKFIVNVEKETVISMVTGKVYKNVTVNSVETIIDTGEVLKKIELEEFQKFIKGDCFPVKCDYQELTGVANIYKENNKLIWEY